MAQPSGQLSTVAGLGAILLWSTTFAVARSLSEQVGPVTAGAAVYTVGGAVCVIRLAVSPARIGELFRLPLRYLLGCGSLFALYTATIYLAIGLARNRDQLLEIALVNYLWPALTLLLSIPLLRKRGRVWLVPGTALALAGVALVMTQGAAITWRTWLDHVGSNPLAFALAFVAAVSWGLYSNLTRRWAEGGGDGAVELFLPATALALIVIRWFLHEASVWSPRAAAETAVLATVTAVAYVLWDLAMRRGNLLLVATCSYFTPLLSTAVSCAYLGVPTSSQLWIGCALLVAGSLITWKSVGEATTTQATGAETTR